LNGDLLVILEYLEKEKGIDKEQMIQAVEQALLTASRKGFGVAGPVKKVTIDRTTGKISAFAEKHVVETVQDPTKEISLQEAQQIDPELKVGDTCLVEVMPEEFGRISAQTAKQIIIQKIREAEREIIYQEFGSKQGEIINAMVQTFEQGAIILDLGKTEGIIPPRERVPGEEFQRGERIKAYLLEVRRSNGNIQVVLSRSHPAFVLKLFEMEVPEIREGIVEIKSISREAGERTKIAVASNDENIDPVGACVGIRGARVKTIVRELRGEKIDIVKWDEDPAVFITNALSPAKVTNVKIDEETHTAYVVVPDDQLSLAIGKKGQNVRLAAKLTGWRIDIRSESQGEEETLCQEVEEVEELQEPEVEGETNSLELESAEESPEDAGEEK